MQFAWRIDAIPSPSVLDKQKDEPQGLGERKEAGYSPKAKIKHLAAVQRANGALRCKCEPARTFVRLPRISNLAKTKNRATRTRFLVLVGEAGFGPAKSVTTDLQSAPFGRSGIPPCNMELVNGVEPSTCGLQISCSAIEPHQRDALYYSRTFFVCQ